MRTIGVVTVARSDYGIYQPLLRLIESAPGLLLHLFVGGMHLSPEFGLTVEDIASDGYLIVARVDMIDSSDTALGVARSIGRGVTGFAKSLDANPPDILLVLGDRYEMLSAAIAAATLRIPLAHIHGGEVSQGALDEGFRHSITKLSHLHFASTCRSARRIIQLGEEPWRVTVTGAPSLDHLSSFEPLAPEELQAKLGKALPDGRFLLVTYHPTTLSGRTADDEIADLLGALDDVDLPAVFTLPNADAEGRALGERIRAYSEQRSESVLVDNLGTAAYFSLMMKAAAMIGNSSSGIIEAPSFELPVVNIGDRQDGRERASNILDVPCERKAIAEAIREAVSARFRQSLRGLRNPYSTGEAAGRIVSVLRQTEFDERLLMKCFHTIGERELA